MPGPLEDGGGETEWVTVDASRLPLSGDHDQVGGWLQLRLEQGLHRDHSHRAARHTRPVLVRRFTLTTHTNNNSHCLVVINNQSRPHLR